MAATGTVERKRFDIALADAEQIAADLAWADDSLERARERLAGDPALQVLRVVPPLGRQIDAADAMAGAGAALTARHEDVKGILDGFIAARDAAPRGPARIRALARFAADHRDEANRLGGALDQARELLEAAPAEGLLPPLASARSLLAERLDQAQPLIEAARTSGDLIPRITGIDGERRYLVLALDNAEVRPIGGLIGAFATPRFRDGALADESFKDIFAIDRHDQKTYVKPPEPLDHHLLGGVTWQVADAGWWPDFARSAAEARRMYEIETGRSDLHGTIAFTPELVDELLKVVGPVRVPEAGITVNPGQTYLISLEQVEVLNRGEGRKAFLAQLASQVLSRLFALPPDRYPEVFEALDRAGKRRQLQVLFDDPVAQAPLTALGWYAPFTFPERSDRLAIMEANVAPVSKLNVLLELDHQLDVTLNPDGNADEKLVTTFTNGFRRNLPPELARVRSTFFSGNLGSFQRRYLAPNAELVAVKSDDRVVPLAAPGTLEMESGCLVVGNYQLVRPGVVHLETQYRVPNIVNSTRSSARVYRLHFHKQPGRDRDTLTIRVTVPEGARVTRSSSGGTSSGRTVTFATTTELDRVFEVEFAPG